MHSGRKENADIRIQEPDALAQAGDAAALVQRRGQRAGLPAHAGLPGALQLVAAAQRRELHEPGVLAAALARGGRLRVGARLALPARRAPLSAPRAPPLVSTSALSDQHTAYSDVASILPVPLPSLVMYIMMRRLSYVNGLFQPVSRIGSLVYTKYLSNINEIIPLVN